MVGLAAESCDSGIIDVTVVERRSSTESAPLEHPLLHWEVVRVPRPGVVESLSGTVEKLLPDQGWVYVQIGESLPATSKLWIHAGDAMGVRFSESEFIEFNPASEDRWVEFDVLQAP